MVKTFIQQHWSLFSFILLIGLFIFTRLFKIQESLLYFNDMGRDSLVLIEWAQTGKPPLLGPQTSALPFNQSALYFYVLYPVFLLTKYSAFSAIFTNVLLYLGSFCVAFWLSRKSRVLTKLTLLTFFLFCIHPQFIIQNRFVWNPSFVGPMILIAFLCFTHLIRSFDWKYLALFSLSIAAATAFSYSALPVLLAFGIASIRYFKFRSLIIGAAVAVSLLIVNAPTIFFELRHNFVLTQMLFNRERLPQSGAGFLFQLRDMTRYSLSVEQRDLRILLGAFFIAVILSALFLSKKNAQNSAEYRQFSCAVFLLSLTVALTLFIPMSIHAHYIFGVVTLAAIATSLLPLKALFPTLLVFTILWSAPILRGTYFQPAARTVAEMESCFAQLCQLEKEPLFVTVQSDFHPYHNGPEHRFLMKKAGCQVANIETEPTQANTMAVILDSSDYEHGKTTYNELSMFGPASESKKYTCQSNFEAVILEKSVN